MNVLVANLNSPDDRLAVTVKNLPWEGESEFEVLAVDTERDLAVVQRGPLPELGSVDLPAKGPAVFLIKVRKTKTR